MDADNTDSNPPSAEQAPVADSPSTATAPLSAPSAPEASEAPQPARKPRKRGAWIAWTLVIILLIVLAGAGGVGYFAYRQYPVLNAVGLRLCDDLVKQNYTDAYTLFSSRLRHSYTASEFIAVNQSLDSIEGAVTQCGQAASNKFSVGAFPIAVSVASTLQRGQAAPRLGNIKFIYENGRWVVDNIDTPLLGINIEALLTVQSLCTDLALQPKTASADAQKYATIWSLYDSHAEPTATLADFAQIGQLHDNLDQDLKECAISQIIQASDSTTQLVITAKHAYSYEVNAKATLKKEGGVWKFTALDASIYGQDLGPALVATKFLYALASGDCATAYSYLTQQSHSLAQFTTDVCDAPLLWALYHIDPTSYNQETPTKYSMGLTTLTYPQIAAFIASNVPFNDGGIMTMVDSGGSWQVYLLVIF